MTKKHSKNKYTVSCSKITTDNDDDSVVDAAAVYAAVQGK